LFNYGKHSGAALLMLCSTICQACFLVTVKQLLALELQPATILMARSLIGILIFSPWMIRKKYLTPKSNLKIHVIRSTAFLIGGVALFTSLNSLPLTTVIMITYTSPIFVCIGAIIIFKEKVSALHIIALLMSVVGVNFLFEGEVLVDVTGVISALVATFMLTVAQLSLKWLSKNENKIEIFVTQLSFTLPIFFSLYILFGELPELTHLPLLLLMSFSFTLGQILLIQALENGELNKLMPLDSVRLILVALSGLLLFGESISTQLLIGSALIMIAAVITLKPTPKLH